MTFTAIYRQATHGTPDIAILATRNTDLTEAMADVEAQQEPGDGTVTVIATTRVRALLDKAQTNLEALRALDPAKFGKSRNFLFNDPQLGTVSVTWTERD